MCVLIPTLKKEEDLPALIMIGMEISRGIYAYYSYDTSTVGRLGGILLR